MLLEEQQLAAATMAQAAFDASHSSTTNRSDGVTAVAPVGSHRSVGHTGSNKSRKVSPAVCASLVEAGAEPKPKGSLLTGSVDSLTLTFIPGRGSSKDLTTQGDSATAVAQSSQSTLRGNSVTAVAPIAGGSATAVASRPMSGVSVTADARQSKTLSSKPSLLRRSLTRKVAAAPGSTTHSSIDHGGPPTAMADPKWP